MSETDSRSLRVRRMQTDDVPFGMSLVATAGWNQVEADWRTFLELRPHGCFVAQLGDRRAGTATSIEYGTVESGKMGWIGMVLVEETLRRRGVGTRLLEAGLESLADCHSVWLDATPEGHLVYEPLGFQERSRWSRWTRDGAAAVPESPSADSVRPLIDTEMELVERLDTRVFGADRAHLLRRIRARSHEHACVTKIASDLRGYCLTRDGRTRTHIGPLVAASLDDARSLLCFVLAKCSNEPLVIDIPDRDPAWAETLADSGFRRERPLIRMSRGLNGRSGDPTRQWASVGPEFG